MRIYVVSLYATRNLPGKIETSVGAAACYTNDEWWAREWAMQSCIEEHPPEEGWHSHSISVKPIKHS